MDIYESMNMKRKEKKEENGRRRRKKYRENIHVTKGKGRCMKMEGTKSYAVGILQRKYIICYRLLQVCI